MQLDEDHTGYSSQGRMWIPSAQANCFVSLVCSLVDKFVDSRTPLESHPPSYKLYPYIPDHMEHHAPKQSDITELWP